METQSSAGRRPGSLGPSSRGYPSKGSLGRRGHGSGEPLYLSPVSKVSIGDIFQGIFPLHTDFDSTSTE